MTIFVRMTLAVAAIFLLATPVAAQFSTGTGKIATGGRGGGGHGNIALSYN